MPKIKEELGWFDRSRRGLRGIEYPFSHHIYIAYFEGRN
jgi:hypothetical protein